MLVEAMRECVIARTSNVANVWGSLSWFSSHHDGLLVNATESINNNLTLDGLDRINDDSDCSWIQFLLTLLSLYISSWKPWAKSWMRVIPTYATLVSTNLFHFVHKLLLINRIHWFDRDCCSSLRHWEDIDHCNCIIIMDFAHHQAHNFEWNTSPAMFKHLQKGQTWNIDLLACIVLWHLCSWLHLWSTSTAHALQHGHHSWVHFYSEIS